MWFGKKHLNFDEMDYVDTLRETEDHVWRHPMHWNMIQYETELDQRHILN